MARETKQSKKEKSSREYRGIIDEIRHEQKKTKDMTFKEKLSYFWYYYKFHTLAAAALIIFAICFIRDMASAKDYSFYGVMLNCRIPSSDGLEQAFAEYAGLDQEHYDCFIDTASTLSYSNANEYDMATTQRLLALAQTGDLDAVVFDSQTFRTYALNGMFYDLRKVLSEETLEAYKDQLYYIDSVVFASDDSTDMEGLETQPETDVEAVRTEAEAHRHPEDMEMPVPVGIFMEDSAFVSQTGLYSDAVPVYGAVVSTTRLETALSYLSFLWDEGQDFMSILTETAY